MRSILPLRLKALSHVAAAKSATTAMNSAGWNQAAGVSIVTMYARVADNITR